MNKEIKFRSASGKTHTLVVSYAKTASKHVCYMRYVETGKSVQGSGNSQAEAHNQALAKIRS